MVKETHELNFEGGIMGVMAEDCLVISMVEQLPEPVRVDSVLVEVQPLMVERDVVALELKLT